MTRGFPATASARNLVGTPQRLYVGTSRRFRLQTRGDRATPPNASLMGMPRRSGRTIRLKKATKQTASLLPLAVTERSRLCYFQNTPSCYKRLCIARGNVCLCNFFHRAYQEKEDSVRSRRFLPFFQLENQRTDTLPILAPRPHVRRTWLFLPHVSHASHANRSA